MLWFFPLIPFVSHICRALLAVFAECAKPTLDEAVALALDGITRCAARGEGPTELKGYVVKKVPVASVGV